MLRINQPPEHVRVEVKAGKVKEEQAGLKLGKLGVENLAVLGQNHACLLQIFLIAKHSSRQSFRIFGNALGVELAHFFGELTRIILGSGKRQRRIGRINVDGRDVELKSRVRLLEIKAADPFDVADEWNQLEFDVDPVAPFSLAQHEFLVLHGELGDCLQRIDGNCEGLE